MKKNGVILMLILLCIAFLVSCAKREITDNSDKGELVRAETLGDFPWVSVFSLEKREDRQFLNAVVWV